METQVQTGILAILLGCACVIAFPYRGMLFVCVCVVAFSRGNIPIVASSESRCSCVQVFGTSSTSVKNFSASVSSLFSI